MKIINFLKKIKDSNPYRCVVYKKCGCVHVGYCEPLNCTFRKSYEKNPHGIIGANQKYYNKKRDLN